MTAANNLENLLEGFLRALDGVKKEEVHSPVYSISSLLLGNPRKTICSQGKRWSAFLAQIETYASLEYIPIVEFPVGKDNADLAGSTVSAVEDMIIRQSSMPDNVAIGLKYMVDECVDNILEHSCSEYGYISSRIDSLNKRLEVCIADRGITVLGSYKANNDPDIKSDLEALQAANRGISTKNLPDAENRGYGLMTTQKMIINGLGGAFAMISGGTVFVNDKKGRRFFDSSDAMKIAGTIIVLNFPFDNKDFRYINYIE